jgi:hypothetical protein
MARAPGNLRSTRSLLGAFLGNPESKALLEHPGAIPESGRAFVFLGTSLCYNAARWTGDDAAGRV